MNITSQFKKDIRSYYEGELDLQTLLSNNDSFIRGIAKYAVRFKTSWYVSDEDDMYQEACFWIDRALWDYDPSKGTELHDYVIYNVGARLKTIIRNERARLRHPDANTSRKLDIWGTGSIDQSGTFESHLASPASTPELIMQLSETIDVLERKLSEESKDILKRLIQNDWNISEVVRELVKTDRYRGDEEVVRCRLRKTILPEIRSTLAATAL